MKKIASIVLSIIFLASVHLSPVNVSAISEDENEDYIAAAVKIGLVNENYAGDENRIATRGEVFQSIVKLCGGRNETFSDENCVEFTDLDSTDTYYSAVQFACSLGFVNGYPDKTIRTEESMAVKDAVRLLLYSLGYKPVLSSGFKINDAVRKADFCSYSDAVSNTPITYSKLCEFILKAGESHIVESNGIKAENGQMKNNYELSTETPLSKYYNIYLTEGNVNSISGADLTLENPVPDGNVRIGNGVYIIGDSLVDTLIGCHVKAYYNNETDTVIYAYPYKNEITTINSVYVEEMQDGKLYYEDKGKKLNKEINLSAIDFIYNGELKKLATSTDFLVEHGTISLIDNNNDNKIDVVNVTEYKVVVADSVSKSGNAILSKFGKGAISTEDYDEFLFISDRNELMEVAEISEWDVISIKENFTKTKATAIYSTAEKEGTITDISYEDGKMYISVNGKEFRVSDDCREYQSNLIKLGTEGIFCLDITGDICAIKASGIRKIGYLMRAKKESSLSDTVNVKILTVENEIKIFEVASKLEYNGEKINNPKEENIPINTIISYSVNKDGLINCIDTPCDVDMGGLGANESTNGSLQKYYDGYTFENGKYTENEQLQYKASSGIIGGKICVNIDTPIFVIPAESSIDEGKYRIYKCGDYLAPDDKIYIQAYRMDSNNFLADAVIIYESSSEGGLLKVPEDSPIYVVDKVKVTVDEFGDDCYLIGAQGEGKHIDYILNDRDVISNLSFNNQPYSIGSGDIIKLSANTSNEIRSIEVCYSYRKKAMKDNLNPNNSEYLHLFHLQYAYAYKKCGTFCQTTTTPINEMSSVDEAALEYLELHNLAKYSMIRYDKLEKKIYSVGADDVIDYVRDPNNCSQMIIYDRFGDPRMIVLYN